MTRPGRAKIGVAMDRKPGEDPTGLSSDRCTAFHVDPFSELLRKLSTPSPTLGRTTREAQVNWQASLRTQNLLLSETSFEDFRQREGDDFYLGVLGPKAKRPSVSLP
jgi:hypothetical protein